MAEECCRREEARSATCETRAPQPDLKLHGLGCPVCQTVGKMVQGHTVKAQVAVSLRAVRGATYRFCRTPICPVVYYADDGTSTFTVEHLRERVYQKEQTNTDVFVCYCFRHTIGDVVDDAEEGQSLILDDITSGIAAGQCACDLRNPQGACCLGNVRALVRPSTRALSS